ncbi:polysaccharide biosynthesis/export family protein [Granulicella aggregans]|jgi:polysaccharide export outer membrane protein|uniref:polysaccharide biosynthesis/export family protein n=1 Tax=Granulicella aggregans TaxID=474949 RepID=UPI0021E0E081|nr:polysaccharide biosynthesis/export family protein [Granulicella aggregans]
MKHTPQLLLSRSVRISALGCGILFASVSSKAFSQADPASQTNSPAASTGTTPQDSGLQRHPLDFEASQPRADEEYLLGGGDDVLVSVAGRPELSGPHVIGPDGRITMPLVGTVNIGEKSRDDAAKAIDTALSKYYSGEMSSTVQVTKYGSNHILLLGAIEHPGIITFDQPPTLLEAVTRGGSVINADRSTQIARRCVIYRGDDKVMNVNLSERFDSKRALNDIRLRRNDIVYIPEDQESLVSVLGEVMRPGPERLTSHSTLTTLLAGAGGITEKAGNPSIQIFTPSTGKVQTIKFQDLLRPPAGSDLALHDGDIIYVPRSGIAKTGYFFQQISPIIGIGTLFTLTR